MKNILTLFLLLLTLSSCNLAKSVVAINKSTDHFKTLQQDSRVLYEEGAQALASQVALRLDDSIFSIETSHYQPFSKPVAIFVCQSKESFVAYCVNKKASGCVSNARLFLAPSSFEKDSFVLTHELSHLHMAMRLESIFWYLKAPVWFHEGLAVYVSNGEGTGDISTDLARTSIAAGKTFIPNASANIFFRKTASSFNLDAHMFYQQSGMFVAFLHDIDEEKFKTFILAVEEGKAFETAFTDAYKQSIRHVWDEFVQLQTQFEQSRHS